MTTNYYCTNCGKEINEQAEICTGCGVRQGQVKNYCYNCGNSIAANQEMCLHCGINPKKIRKPKAQIVGASGNKGNINVILSAIVGYVIPGLPSILWLNQKAKGVSLIIAAVVCLFLLPVIGNIILGIFTAIDAYQLSKRVNFDESLGDWTFFWDN